MKKLLVIVPLLLFGSDKVCTKCTLNKAQMKCEYYVALKGDASKASLCENYADYLNKTQVYGKASWYYLLAKKPRRAIEAAKNAIKNGENFAYEYMADGYLILGQKDLAKKYYAKFKEAVGDPRFFVSKDFKVLGKLYKDFDPKELR